MTFTRVNEEGIVEEMQLNSEFYKYCNVKRLGARIWPGQKRFWPGTLI